MLRGRGNESTPGPSFPVVVAVLAALVAAAAAAAAGPASLHASLVEIVVTSDPPDPWVPWRRTGPVVGSGSGVIVAGNRILTAAHVITGAVMIEVARSDVGERFTAEVEHACHVCDLAVLRVADPRFFARSVALSVGELPKLQQRVQVHGFPLGGEGLSVTSGIVSRVAVDFYAHSGSRLLLAQVDAAVNPGNSGGPAISDGRIAGIAMQMLGDAENIAYIIPAPIIEHFLADVKDGRVDGFPELDIWIQPLGNASLRKRLGLTNGSAGVLVTAVSPTGSADGTLEPGDVLLAIGGVAVGADGDFAISDGVRVEATVIEHRAQVGERVALRFLRDGAQREATVVMKKPRSLVPLVDYDRGFSYRIYAGLVFQPLTARHLAEFVDPPSHLAEYLVNPVKSGYRTLVPGGDAAGREEVVMLASVLRAELTRSYEDLEQQVIYAVGGTPVRNLRHLSDLIDAAAGEFVTFTTEAGNVIAVDRALAATAGPEILERYQIGSSRSADLRAPSSAKR
jgi:S1-C subfamily serine protease